MRIYTRRGDDGTTGLLHGPRVPKDDPRIAAVGDVDEAQAAIGVARAGATGAGELDDLLVSLERDLWVLMAEVGTDAGLRQRLEPGSTSVAPAMVERLEALIDDVTTRFEAPRGFVVPGQQPVAAALDVARAVVRRAERSVVALDLSHSLAAVYLNRLSDLLWTMARWQEGESLLARQAGDRPGAEPSETPEHPTQ